ncbi:MAG: queuosine salvage family protein [Thermoanaerobaculia bacterium]
MSDPSNAALRWPKPIGSPVLDSLRPVIRGSEHVRTDVARIGEVARWMAYEKLPFPQFGLDFDPVTEREQAIDFTMVSNTINTAFTDFETGVKFKTDYQGQTWSDSMAMTACLKRAIAEGVPVLDGRYLAEVTHSELAGIFSGNIEMPMLDEKLAVLNQVGERLAEHYDGFFHNFLETCSPRLFDGGKGLIDRLIDEFPRFDDSSSWRGHKVHFHKLAQLTYWGLHSAFKPHGGFRIDDIASMTAFADYIVPVALRVMGILVYSTELEKKINSGRLIPRDSDEEIEIRAHMIYATALLTEDINALRPDDSQIIIPQLDARLWSSYHTTHWPHHLTKTIMY